MFIEQRKPREHVLVQHPHLRARLVVQLAHLLPEFRTGSRKLAADLDSELRKLRLKARDAVIETPHAVIETPDSLIELPDAVIETPDAVIKLPDTVIKTADTVIKTADAIRKGLQDLHLALQDLHAFVQRLRCHDSLRAEAVQTSCRRR
jgi:hypothetical protein